MPERSDVLRMNVEKNVKEDATFNCWRVLARILAAIGE